jgi:hypothetical protein
LKTRATNKRFAVALWLILLLSTAPLARADEPADDTHPVLSADAGWVHPMVLTIGGLFAAALVVGPIILARNPRIVADATSHEEDPSADRHSR